MDALSDVVKRIAYDSDTHNLLEEFYIPALSVSTKYFRITGYFSSTSIKVASKGVRNLIKNGGTMRLITGVNLTSADYDAIEKSVLNLDEVISKNISEEIDKFTEDDFSLQHAKLLGWMLRNNILEMKIAIKPEPGIFHQKVGILQDTTENRISFSGSNNETASGWLHNDDEFKVFREWEDGQLAYFESDMIKFNTYWYDRGQKTRVYNLPDAIKEKLIKIAPEKYEDLDLGYDDGVQSMQKETKELWKHQKDAIKAWITPPAETGNRPFQGIFSMATASGKTLTAIHASILADKNTITLIAMPTVIMGQWTQEIREVVPDAKIIFGGGDDSDWKERLPIHLAPYRLSSPNQTYRTFVLCTYQSLNSPEFQNLFRDIDSKFVQIIADEVHHAGTESTSSMFEMKADRVLGLSATHTRHWDDLGTDAILDYFGQPVFEFSLADGIKLGILCHYRFIPHFVTMTATEQDEYKEHSRRIGIIQSKIRAPNVSPARRLELQRDLTVAQNTRKKIIRKAENKTSVCREVLAQFFNVNDKAIIFCDDSEQEQSIINILREQNKEMREYSAKRTPSERNSALRDFRSGIVNFLLGIKMLDEGIDIPDAEQCLIVASTTNPREFIQRRGRILRKTEKNSEKIAVMHDLVILPSINIPQGRDLTSSEEKAIDSSVKIVQGEFCRVLQLITSADNTDQVIIWLREQARSLGIEERVNFTI